MQNKLDEKLNTSQFKKGISLAINSKFQRHNSTFKEFGQRFTFFPNLFTFYFGKFKIYFDRQITSKDKN